MQGAFETVSPVAVEQEVPSEQFRMQNPLLHLLLAHTELAFRKIVSCIWEFAGLFQKQQSWDNNPHEEMRVQGLVQTQEGESAKIWTQLCLCLEPHSVTTAL